VPAGNSGTEAYVRIGFPDDYTIETSDLTATASSCGATSLPGTLVATGNNTDGQKSITISGVTNLAATTAYCVDIDREDTNDPITNPSAGQYSLTIETQDSSNDPIDDTTIAA